MRKIPPTNPHCSPIAEKMYAVLHEGLKPHEAIDDLMERKLKEE